MLPYPTAPNLDFCLGMPDLGFIRALLNIVVAVGRFSVNAKNSLVYSAMRLSISECNRLLACDGYAPPFLIFLETGVSASHP